MQKNKNYTQNTTTSPEGKVSSRVVYNSPNPNSTSRLNINNNNSNQIKYQDPPISGTPKSQEYGAVLKNVGYVIGDPIPVFDKNKVARPTTPKLGEQFQQSPSRNTSRVIYSNGTIIHDHPSRPVRSPSPIFCNPNANVVPHTKFIYNTTSTQVTQVEKGSRVALTQTPPKYQPIISAPQPKFIPPIITTSPLITTQIPFPPLTPTKSQPPFPPLTPTSNQGMVPRSQYQNCVKQCRNWEKKYNQLYGLYLKTKSEAQISINNRSTTVNNESTNMLTRITNNNNTQQYEYIVRQNRKLKQRVRQLERNQQKLTGNLEDVISNLVNKYKDSTLKECMLLTDRYRLEKKMNQK